MTYHFFLFYTCCLLLAASCMQGGVNQASSTTEKRKDGKIAVAEFIQLLEDTKHPQLIDVRTPREFSDGHLEGALNIDFNDVNFVTNIEQIDKSKPVFIYCRSGGRSGKAYKKMKTLGFNEVYDLDGGYLVYKKTK